MRISQLKEATEQVFTQPKYIIMGLLFAVFVFIFNALVTNLSLLWNFFSIELFWNLLLGIRESMAVYAIISMFILSLLGGVVLSMSVFLVRRQIAFNAGTGSGGIFMSIIAPSCSACAVGVLGILGIGGVLSVLPFHGSEFSVIALLLLVFSIMYLSKKIVTVSCKV